MSETTYNRDHLPSLDGLRAVAILLVLWFHVPREVLPEWLNRIAVALDPGYFGVDLFFVLSGFLVTRILLFNKTSKNDRSLVKFYLRRTLRIFPIYYLVLVVCATQDQKNVPWSFFFYLNNYVYIFDDGPGYLRHTWSLAVEEHFYLFFPLLVYFLPNKVGTLASFFVIPTAALASISGFRCVADDPERIVDFVYMATNVRVISLCFGAGLAYIEPWMRISWKRSSCMAALAVFASASVLLFLPKSSDFYFELRTLFASGVCCGTLLGVASADWGKLKFNPLHFPVLAYIGSISYGLYLYHQPVFELFGLRESPTTANLIFATMVVFSLASLSYKFIELPILNFGKCILNNTSLPSQAPRARNEDTTEPRFFRVAIQQASLASYRVPVFRDLAKLPALSLTVFSGGLRDFDNQTSSDFQVVEVPIRRIRLLGIPVFWHVAQWQAVNRSRFDVAVLVWNVQYVHLIPSLVRARLTGVRVVLWGHGYSKQESWFRRFPREVVARFADSLLFYDHHTAKDFISRHPWASSRCYVAPNTIDTTSILRCKDRLLGTPAHDKDTTDTLLNFRESRNLLGPTLLYVSRFDPDNRVDLLVEAVSRLVPQIPSLRLIIIGKGNPESDSLCTQIRQLGLDSHVIVKGAIYEEEELAPWFCSANLFVYPSNIGLSLNHAMAYGLPVITSDALEKQNPEIHYLVHGKNGFLFRDGSVDGLVDVIRLALDPEQQGRLSEGANQTMSFWTLSRMVDGLRDSIHGVDTTNSLQNRPLIAISADGSSGYTTNDDILTPLSVVDSTDAEPAK